jgi:hypothetical protein
MIAAHGKGKSDGASALLKHMEKHAPEYAARVLRTVLRAESEAGGREFTEGELLRAARRAYRVALRPRTPMTPQKVGHAHGRRVKHE